MASSVPISNGTSDVQDLLDQWRSCLTETEGFFGELVEELWEAFGDEEQALSRSREELQFQAARLATAADDLTAVRRQLTVVSDQLDRRQRKVKRHSLENREGSSRSETEMSNTESRMTREGRRPQCE